MSDEKTLSEKASLSGCFTGQKVTKFVKVTEMLI